MLEVVWKVVEAVIDTQIKSVFQYHGILHGFCTRRGTRTTIIELKLAQELESVDQDPPFLLFLDLRKACDNIYRGRLLKNLEGYGAGPKLRGLLAEFWSRQELVTRHNGFHGPQLQANRGTTQGGLASTTRFNVAVYSVVRH